MAQVGDLVVTLRADVATSALYRILGLADYDLDSPLTHKERLARIAEIVREAIVHTEVTENGLLN